MNSLYQIRSKIMRGTKVIILAEKKIKKEMAWPGFELTNFILEGKSANHYTAWILDIDMLFFMYYKIYLT